jgi:hypothetical protein
MHLQIPPYIKGEALYGYVCRIHYLSSTRSWKETNTLLFNKPSVRLNPALPAHIDAVASIGQLDPIELLLHATCYPIVAMTLPRDDQQRLAAMMRGTSGGGVASVSRTTSSRLPSIRLIKACPVCIEIDEECYGSPVWWTKHQIYGVTACPTHLCKLVAQRAGEGGFNKQLLLPLMKEPGPTKASEKHCFLSTLLVNLYDYLTCTSPLSRLSSLYLVWLHKLGYATPSGQLRLQPLKHNITDWWKSIFSGQECDLPSSLKGFEFIPSLIHERGSQHYIKHALLIGFTNESISAFFNLEGDSIPQTSVTPTADPPQREEQLCTDLLTGTSMRKIAADRNLSVSYIKQFASKHSLAIDTKPLFITEDVARTVWRKAFYGIHRQTIAESVGVSTGAVESIIQSHRGLSRWRKHLRRVVRLRNHRKNLIQCLTENPNFSRNEVKDSASAAYLWLYKNDREWLYAQLPPREVSRYHASVNWEERDMILSEKLSVMAGSFRSLSEVDRSIGGHGWLLREQIRLPKTTKVAKSLLKMDSTKKPE